ncbi:hypothetical protein ACN47E_009856 [Coniothyrium glycines]
MISGLQPSRPKPPQQSALPGLPRQQRRAAHEEVAHATQPLTSLQAPHNPNFLRPRSQIEAMPPFGPPQSPATFFQPIYDSAVRHPVFFTQNLKKPPFPIPQLASQGWNPVASGYIMEQKREETAGRTKL